MSSAAEGAFAPDAARRARALERLRVAEELPAELMQRVVRLAAHIAGGDGVRTAVHLIDDRVQHRVVGVGDAPWERTPAGESLCLNVVEDGRVAYTPDVPSDPRYAGHERASGESPVRLFFAAPLRIDGGPVGTLCVFDTRRRALDEDQQRRLADLADLAAAQLELVALTRELGHDAAHDALTGMPNRVLLADRLTAALARRDGAPVLLLVDLDGFKALNDRHGHAVGDQVLCSTAERLRAAVRPEDVVARIGGDEFAVLVDAADDDAVPDLVRRLLVVAQQPHVTTAGRLVCAFTVGVGRGRPGDLPYELLGRADADLYVGKVRPRQGA